MARVLYATVGTNTAAITSVLAAIYEAVGYDRAVLLATSVSRRYAEAAVARLRELLDNPPSSITTDTLMDSAVRDPGSVVQELQGRLKGELLGGNSVVVDVTGGTKLMSSLASIAASISTGAAVGENQLLLTYTSSHGVDRLVAWWRVGEETGFYPRTPRILAKPVIFDLASGASKQPTPNPTRVRTPQRLETLSYRRGEGLQPLVKAVGVVQQLLNSVARDEARVYVALGGGQRVHALSVRGLGYDPGVVEARLGTLFTSRDAARELFDALYPGAVEPGGQEKRERMFEAWYRALQELTATVGLKRLEVVEQGGCKLDVDKYTPLVDLLDSMSPATQSSGGYRIWGDTNLAYHGAHNDIFELAWRVALRGGRAEPGVLRFPACAHREALTRYMEKAKQGTSDVHAVLASIASMVTEEYMEEGVDGLGSCEANMLMRADDKTMLVTNDKGAFNAWREAGACAIRVAPRTTLSSTSLSGGESSEKEAEAMRILAAAAQLIAILAAMLRDTNAPLIIEGDKRTAKIRGLAIQATPNHNNNPTR